MLLKKLQKNHIEGILLKGNIEGEFLYATLLSSDIVPFGHLPFRVVVLPLIQNEDGYILIKEDEASRRGFIHLSKWLSKAQKIWEEKRGDKAESMDIYQRLDRVKGITSQKSTAKYKVLYPTSATFLCGCVVEKRSIKMIIEGQEIELQGFIADHKTYVFETNKKAEALYLCSILNSGIVDELIKPMQSRGLFGPRDIHKKVWELFIPEFDSINEDHRTLAKLGEKCTKKVSRLISKSDLPKSIGKLRSLIRAELEDEINEIDEIVKSILK